jgi:TRAP-type C4-dicarboxylate transport system permease small subunit
MAYTLRSGNHLRTTLFLGRMPPVAQRAVLIANSVIGIGLFVLIAWLGWIEFGKSWEIGAFEGEHPVRIPVWPVWAILVGGAVLTAVQFALDALRYLTEGPRRSELSEVEDTHTR